MGDHEQFLCKENGLGVANLIEYNGYGLRSSHPTQPTYATLTIGWDKIEYKCYKIMNTLSKDINGNTIVVPYGSQTRELYDECTLNWRAKGQTLI